MSRPAVDVVVPFRGTKAKRDELAARLARLNLGAGDTVLIVDNTPGQERTPMAAQEQVLGTVAPAVSTLVGPGVRIPADARNRGARLGRAPWIVFLDDDVDPRPELLDLYFAPEPEAQTALLAGGVEDEFVAPGGRPVARYLYLRAASSQDDTFRFGEWGFPKTANVAIRRSAFEALGGFRSHIRAGEDSDLTFRLRGAGWGVERREDASVVHHVRQTLRSFVVQKATHGAGGAWLDRQHPGASPPRGRPGLVWWAVRHSVAGLARAVLERDRDRALWAVFEPVEYLAFEFGRSLPNERPLTLGAWWRAVRRLRRTAGQP